MNFINFFRKILSFFLVVAFVSPVFVVGIEDSLALDNITIKLGNHDEGKATNMMIQFQISNAFEAGESIVIDFENDVDLSNLDATCVADMLLETDDDGINDYESDGSTVDNDEANLVITTGTTANQVTCAVNTGESKITFSLNAASTSISAGMYLRLFIGPKDGLDLYDGVDVVDIISGADPLDDNDFKDAAASALGTGAVQPIVLPDDVSTSVVIITEDSGETQSGAFAVGNDLATSDELVMNVTLEPYITLDITDSTLELGTFSADLVGREKAEMEIVTNAENGYTLRYRADDLNNVSETVSLGRNDPVSVLGEGEWGINLVANNDGVSTVGALPTLITAGKGVDPAGMAEDNYKIANQYFMGALNTLEALISNPNPTGDVITITAAVKGSSVLPAGQFSATVTMNVYANF